MLRARGEVVRLTVVLDADPLLGVPQIEAVHLTSRRVTDTDLRHGPRQSRLEEAQSQPRLARGLGGRFAELHELACPCDVPRTAELAQLRSELGHGDRAAVREGVESGEADVRGRVAREVERRPRGRRRGYAVHQDDVPRRERADPAREARTAATDCPTRYDALQVDGSVVQAGLAGVDAVEPRRRDPAHGGALRQDQRSRLRPRRRVLHDGSVKKH